MRSQTKTKIILVAVEVLGTQMEAFHYHFNSQLFIKIHSPHWEASSPIPTNIRVPLVIEDYFVDALEDWVLKECDKFAKSFGNLGWNNALHESLVSQYTEYNNQTVMNNSVEFMIRE